jgi:hypothetical protein
MDWKPIETIPMNEPVLLFSDKCNSVWVGVLDGGDAFRVAEFSKVTHNIVYNFDFNADASHWMPLPHPPTDLA